MEDVDDDLDNRECDLSYTIDDGWSEIDNRPQKLSTKEGDRIEWETWYALFRWWWNKTWIFN